MNCSRELSKPEVIIETSTTIETIGRYPDTLTRVVTDWTIVTNGFDVAANE